MAEFPALFPGAEFIGALLKARSSVLIVIRRRGRGDGGEAFSCSPCQVSEDGRQSSSAAGDDGEAATALDDREVTGDVGAVGPHAQPGQAAHGQRRG